ncbi:MAG: hypothetical protein ACR2HO_02940 [Rubrobacteraceae bacterium]
MAKDVEKRLSPAEVEMVLRRASELNARGRSRGDEEPPSISPQVLVQVAAAAGIPEGHVRRAMWDLASAKTAESHTLSRKLYGPARLRIVREIERPAESTREHLESMLRVEQGLKLRRRTEASSLYDSGDMVGAVRRALDFSGHRALLKAQSVELRVEDLEEGRGLANLTADASNQRGEYLSLGLILGATLALLFVFAGFQSPIFFLGVLPTLAVPAFGFRLAYNRTRVEIRRTLEALLDAAEEGPPQNREPEDREAPPGRIQGLKPIPRFVPKAKHEE